MKRMSVHVFVVALLLVAVVAACIGVGAPVRAVSASTPQEVSSYTVQPGQSLWTYAEMITPAGGDVSASVDELMRLNGMSGTQVQAGQRIIVPER